MQLHQVVAIVDGRKTRANEALTAFYHVFQKDSQHASFSGLIRTYAPLDAESKEKLPDERKNVQCSVANQLDPVLATLAESLDTVYAQDLGNCSAKADLVVDEVVILRKVPVTTLLFLAKRLEDLKTVVDKLPTLDPAEDWEFDDTSNSYKSKPSSTMRLKKVMKNHVKYDATKEHPAQVETYTEDVPVGTWTAIKFSGAIPAVEKVEMLARIRKLSDAVKVAREQANQEEVSIENGWSKSFLDFIFKK